MKVSIIDYGLSNLLSVRRAAEYCGAQVEFVQTPEAVLAAPRLILPGVGAFEDGMNGLAALRGSVMGTQFHPEKSGPVGLSILKAFLEL